MYKEDHSGCATLPSSDPVQRKSPGTRRFRYLPALIESNQEVSSRVRARRDPLENADERNLSSLHCRFPINLDIIVEQRFTVLVGNEIHVLNSRY